MTRPRPAPGSTRPLLSLAPLVVLVSLASSCASAAKAPAPSAAPSQTRRLSLRELGNVVVDLVATPLPAQRFTEETYDTGYDSGPLELTLQTDAATALESSASDLARSAVAKQRPLLLGACVPERDGQDACARAFVDGFASRAFRRPLRSAEAKRLTELLDSASQVGGFDLGLEIATTAVLESAPLLYRDELGEVIGARRRLTPLEAASALAFFVTGTMPDPALMQAANEGRLSTGEDRRREAARLLASPAARSDVRQFLLAWLGLTGLGTTAKNHATYPDFDGALGGAMVADVTSTIDDAIWQGEGSLARLFTSEPGVAAAPGDPRLAALYAAPGGAMDPAARRGVLTRAGFLTAHSASDGSGPIARGVFVRSALLCAPPPPPPPDIPRTVSAASGHTTRERFAAHAQSAFCQGCHASIDGIGFGFEQFDGIGRLRVTEGGETVDTSGALDDQGRSHAFVGVAALEELLVASPSVTSCFVRQLFRFAMGRGELPADEPALAALIATFGPHARVTDLVLALASSDAFVDRGAP